jgi:hypothetical protein
MVWPLTCMESRCSTIDSVSLLQWFNRCVLFVYRECQDRSLIFRMKDGSSEVLLIALNEIRSCQATTSLHDLNNAGDKNNFTSGPSEVSARPS